MVERFYALQSPNTSRLFAILIVNKSGAHRAEAAGEARAARRRRRTGGQNQHPSHHLTYL